MTKESAQEVSVNSSHKRKSGLSFHKKMMPTIKCLCGLEFLVLPDLKAMNRALKNHLLEHKHSNDDLVSLNSLEEFFIIQILIAASKMNLRTIN